MNGVCVGWLGSPGPGVVSPASLGDLVLLGWFHCSWVGLLVSQLMRWLMDQSQGCPERGFIRGNEEVFLPRVRWQAVVESLLFIYLFSIFCLFRATPVAYGGSQDRDPTGATATGLYHSQDCELHHSSRHCRIPNPPSEARDRTCILMDASQIHFQWATAGTPKPGLCP